MTIDAKTQAIIDQIRAEVAADGGPVGYPLLKKLGFTNVGKRNRPLWRSPSSKRGGPGCCILVDPLLGCDGWEVGDLGDSAVITPPISLGQLLRLADGLGIVLTRNWRELLTEER